MSLGIAVNSNGADCDCQRKNGEVLIDVTIKAFIDSNVFTGIDKAHVV